MKIKKIICLFIIGVLLDLGLHASEKIDNPWTKENVKKLIKIIPNIRTGEVLNNV